MPRRTRCAGAGCRFLVVMQQSGYRVPQHTLQGSCKWQAVVDNQTKTSQLACQHGPEPCVTGRVQHTQVRAKQLDIAGVEEQMAKLDSMLKEARGQTDKVQKEYNAMSEKVGCWCGLQQWAGADMYRWLETPVLGSG